MTGAQAKAKARREVNRLLEETEQEEIENAELNLVPYLDIVTDTVMFLLLTIKLVLPMVNLNVTQPPVAPPGSHGAMNDQKKMLNLSVAVTREGFTILASSGKVEIARRADGSLDFGALTKDAGDIKQRVGGHVPDDYKFNLTANPGIPYYEVVGTIDAMRGAPKEVVADPSNPGKTKEVCNYPCLFPDVAFATDIH